MKRSNLPRSELAQTGVALMLTPISQVYLWHISLCMGVRAWNASPEDRQGKKGPGCCPRKEGSDSGISQTDAAEAAGADGADGAGRGEAGAGALQETRRG